MSFEGEIDWEELAIKLIRENRVLKRRLEDLEKEKNEEDDKIVDWSDRMADEDSGMPRILITCSPVEREELFRRVQKKIVGGKWEGAWFGTHTKRPAFQFEPQSMRDKELRGELPRKMIPRKSRPGQFQRLSRNLVFPLPHILLIHSKKWPKAYDVASHLCHNRECCDVSHMAWESDATNKRRETCRKNKKCTCGEEVSCRFDCK